mgnify:CR=1 FL=1
MSQIRLPIRRQSKYRAVPTTVEGIRFHSKREAARYQELRLLEKAGSIHRLRCQPELLLSVPDGSGLKAWSGGRPAIIIGAYRGDFEYCECLAPPEQCKRPQAQRVIEDVKGYDTPLSRWKRKHAESEYGIVIQVVK